ncbi:MAG: replicative DNA helicase [Brevundimonas sp.]|uniref:replicative DNA helicase n=1 Tax=Brevundimonas sp. TaxID=1871086 RepID=UPI003001DBDE
MTTPRDHTEAQALPSNIEAEQALLGCLLYDNAAFERIPERLKAEHFFEPFHQRLFQEIVDHIAAGTLAEPELLKARFEKDPAFEPFGGLGYLLDLVDRAPPAMKAKDYAASIYDLAVRRELIRIAGDMAVSAADLAVPAAEHLSNAEGSLFGLAESGEQAKAVATFGQALDEAVAQAEAAFKRDGKLTGLATDLIDLDQKLGGLHPSDLLILAGRPSMGKTSLATNIAYNVARSFKEGVTEDGEPVTLAGGRVFFASLEMSKSQLAQRIISDRTDISSDKIRKGQIDAADFRKIMDARDELRSIPLYIDETGGISISRLAARARRQHRRTGLDLIVVDYLQLLTTGDGKGRNRVQEITEITGGLKALAKELNVPILALSQLSRQVESRDDKRPMLSDLRESGSIEQDADVVMFVFRESYYLGRSEPKPGSSQHLEWTEQMQAAQGLAECIIGKQRHGPIGTVRLSFNEDTTRFGNLARDYQDVAYRAPYGDE